MANEIAQQITAAEALQMASLGPQEFPIPSAPNGAEGAQRFEVSEIVALLKELGEQDYVRVYFAYVGKEGTQDYRWLNGVILGSYTFEHLIPDLRVDPTTVDPDHVQFLTTMSEDSSQVYPHQISAERAKYFQSLGYQPSTQAFLVSGLFALLSTIEEQTPADEKKWVYVYYAYNDDKSLRSVILGCRPITPGETSTAKDPFTVEFLDHTNEYPST